VGNGGDLRWDSFWIGPESDPRSDIGVFEFRLPLKIEEFPDQLRVRISADQRYKLYVNDVLIGFGPQRGDALHWHFETYDLSPFLNKGLNKISVLVWNFGRWAPMAQHSVRTGFVCDCIDTENPAANSLRTPGDWRFARLNYWDFAMMHGGVEEFYIDVGPGEILDGAKAEDLKSVDADEDRWSMPHKICVAEERGCRSGGVPWMLIPRTLPPMSYLRREKPIFLRRGFAGDEPSAHLTDRTTFAELLPVSILPNKPILLDFEELLCAYPRLKVVGARGTRITMTYAESLWETGEGKGNRNDVKNKQCRGYQDVIICGEHPTDFEPLWWRTFRYIRLEATAEVVLEDIYAIETGYPLNIESSFTASEPCVERLWETGERTIKRCAGETYFDCPYYEQLQYVGDTRLQALIGYYIGRDRQLQRNAVKTLGWSIMDNGLPQSRYPSRQTQVIPPFSIWYVLMLLDQFLYDPEFSEADRRHSASVARSILEGMRNLPREQPFWPFVDWMPGWQMGVPPEDFRLPLERAMLELGEAAASIMEGDEFSLPQLDTARFGAQLLCGRDQTTPHTEAITRIAAGIRGEPYPSWPEEDLKKVFTQEPTYYFSYYKHLAMFSEPEKASPELDYFDQLDPWMEMMQNGLSTFAENPEPTRSDCHAWSAHPILGFFQIVAGVTSCAPGWSRALMSPHPGNLRMFQAKIAHPKGTLQICYENEKFCIDSPVPFHFRWRGLDRQLEAGVHDVP